MDTTYLNKGNNGVFIVTQSASATTAHPQGEMSMESEARQYHQCTVCLCFSSPPPMTYTQTGPVILVS